MAKPGKKEASVLASTQLAVGFDRDGSDGIVSSDTLLNEFAWTVSGNEFVPPYWSRGRDIKLREFWHQRGAGHLASAMYSAQSKLSSIPFSVVARDSSIASHVEEAVSTQFRLKNFSEFAQGLDVTMARFYEDLLSTDNGGFIEVIGAGKPDGPIEGQPFCLRHLDSARCTRTGDPIFPVRYRGDDGNERKLHFTRVIFVSQMPSPRRELNGVGYCAVSRALDFGQALMDVTLYKREQLGSRPTDAILLGKGIRGEDIMKVMRAATNNIDAAGKGVGYTVALGSDDPTVDLKKIQLKNMDGMDHTAITAMSMAAIALAFGMEPADLWPLDGASTKAGEIVSLMRARGKLPIQVMSAVEREFGFKVLPPYLRIEFSYVDDEEDKNRAAVADIRARMRHRNMDSGVTNVQFERRRMMMSGDMTREEFVEAELRDGRLESGLPVTSLLFSDDAFYSGPDGLLNIGIADPLVVTEKDLDKTIALIMRNRQSILSYMANAKSVRDRRNAQKALAANEQLLKLYNPDYDPKADLRSDVDGGAPQRVDGRADRGAFRDRVNGGSM